MMMTMRGLWLVAWLVMSTALQAADDPMVDLARGHNAFALSADEVRDVRITVPAGTVASLHVHNFGPHDLSVEARSPALGAMTFAPEHAARRIPMSDFGQDVVLLRLHGQGDVWLSMSHSSDDTSWLEATLSSKALAQRGRFWLRGAASQHAQGQAAEWVTSTVRGTADLFHAGHEHEAMNAFAAAADLARGTEHESEFVYGLMTHQYNLDDFAGARTSAERVVELLGESTSDEQRAWRYDAHVVLAGTTASDTACLEHSRAALAVVADATRLPDGGLGAMLLQADAVTSTVGAEQAESHWSEAMERGRSLDDREAFASTLERMFERARTRQNVITAARVLGELETLRRTPRSTIHDCGRRAQLAKMRSDRWGEVEHLTSGVQLAIEAGDLELEVLFVSLKGQALTSFGFVEQGRDLIEHASAKARELPANESRYLALRSMGSCLSHALGRETDGVDPFAWTRRWRDVREIYEQAQSVAEELESPKMLGDITYLLAVHYDKRPDQRAMASELAGQALQAGLDHGDGVLAVAAKGLLVQLDYDRGAEASDVIDAAQDVVRGTSNRGLPHGEINARAFVAQLALDIGDLDEVGRQAAAVRELAARALRGVTDTDHVSRRFARYDLAHWSYIDQDWAAAKIDSSDGALEAIDAGARAADRWSLLGVDDPAPEVPARAVAASLERDTVVVRYASGKTQLYAYVVTHEGVEHHTLGALVPLQKRVADFRRGLSDRDGLYDVDQVMRDGHALWTTLVADVVSPDALAECQQLVIVPTPWLSHLPFEALVHEARASASTFADVPFVLTQFGVRYMSSLAAVNAGPSGVVAANLSLLVTGASDYESAGASGLRRGELLADLPHARTEALAIKALGGASVELRLGEMATRSSVLERLPDFDVLHFAVHGLVGDDPRDSGLAFVDGVLSAADIRQLALSPELVVLSACDTAVGLERPSQRVDSLAAAFSAAGAQGVVATLWPVQDATTAALMTEFYEAFLDDGLEPTDALTRARRHVLTSSVDDLMASVAAVEGLVPRGGRLRDATEEIPDGHPHIWSPFVYTGARRR